jgi:hypothetical protein
LISELNCFGVDHLNDLSARIQKNTKGIKTDFSQLGFNIGIRYLVKKG